MLGYFYDEDDSALLSQAKDDYVFEKVTKINCSGFSDDSALPSKLETRLPRLKSLPASSSSRKLLSNSKSMTSYLEKKNRAGNVSSVSDFSNQIGKSCPLDASVKEAQILSGLKRNPSVNTRGRGGALGDFHDFGRTGSSSARFSQQGKILSPTTQIMTLLPREKSRSSSSSFISSDLDSPRFEENPRGMLGAGSGRIGSTSPTRASQQGKIMTPTTKTLKLLPKENSRTSSRTTSIELASPSSSLRPEEGMNKSKSRFLRSWLGKLSLAQTMGCLQGKSSYKSTEIISWEEEFKKAKKRVAKKNRSR